ncbi:MAG: 16S rRNA (cytidine(1402)-2'-O)-methyltransferase [Nitrospirae bacterium]|nr:16S rRNA (cytidine(1402)-2'-O)-methyltransferase [Nitrospirota bacterium]
MMGELYIVSTPIGNLEDITLRALKVLREVDLIAAEDTRHSLKLLNHYGISKPLISYWREKEKARTKVVMDKLKDGLSVALVTDAGTPGISDPGEVLIREAIKEGVQVTPIPGPASLIAALSVSGLDTGKFYFAGFLSGRPVQRRKDLLSLKSVEVTLVFYESPHRIEEFLADLLEVLGDREMALCHELTKMFETVLRGPVSVVIEALHESKIAGEYVAVVAGIEPGAISMESALIEVEKLMRGGKGRKEAVEEVALAGGVSKKTLYKESLTICGLRCGL